MLGVSSLGDSNLEHKSGTPPVPASSSSSISINSVPSTFKIYSDKLSADLVEFNKLMGHSMTQKHIYRTYQQVSNK